VDQFASHHAQTGPAAAAAPAPVPNAPGELNAPNGQPGNPDDASARAVVPSLPPLNLLATIQASPQGADDDDDDEHRQARPKHVPQKDTTKHKMTHKHAQAPEAPWTRGMHMLALWHKQTIPTIGSEEGPGVADPSILLGVMPHQVADDAAGTDAGARAGVRAAVDANSGADAGGAGNVPKRHTLTHSPAACMLAGPMYLTWKQHRLGRVEYQAWFCQQCGLEPPCLAPYAGQHCSCGRFYN
jgi:hypothetical protein